MQILTAQHLNLSQNTTAFEPIRIAKFRLISS